MVCIIWIIFSVSLAFVAIVFVSMLFLRKKFSVSKSESKISADKLFLDYLLKSLVILFLLVAVSRLFLYDSFILIVNGGRAGMIATSDIAHSIVRWGYALGVLVLPMAVFFKSRLFKSLSVFVSLPFTIAAVITVKRFLFYINQEGGAGISLPTTARQLLLSLELCLALIIPLIFIVCQRHYIKFNRRELIDFFVSLPFVLLLACPVAVPQSLVGVTNISISLFSVGNVFWLIFIVAQIIVLYRIFRFKNYRQRYMLCVLLAIASVYSSLSLFSMGFTLSELPVTLDKLCVYLMLIALLTKKQRLFNFCFIGGVTMGVLLSVVASTRDGGAFSFWSYHFIAEHTAVIVLPILASLLRIFDRVTTTRAYKQFAVGLCIYLAAVFVLGTLLNGFAFQMGQGKVNYMYLFDMSLFSGALKLPDFMSISIIAGNFLIYPLYVIMGFGAYLLIGLLSFFMLQRIYLYADDQLMLRNARLAIQERITGKKSNAPRAYLD